MNIMEIDYIAIGERIEDLRTKRKPKVSRMKLGEFVGVSDVSVYRWERAIDKPELIHLAKVADYFKVSLAGLLGEKDLVIDIPKPSKNNKFNVAFWSDFASKYVGLSQEQQRFVAAIVYGKEAAYGLTIQDVLGSLSQLDKTIRK